MTELTLPAAPVAHKQHITLGRARVVWAEETVDCSGRLHLAGWVIPGGARTRDRDKAHAVAWTINVLLGRWEAA